MKTKGTESLFVQLVVLIMVLSVLVFTVSVGITMIKAGIEETGGTRLIYVLDCANGSCPDPAPTGAGGQ